LEWGGPGLEQNARRKKRYFKEGEKRREKKEKQEGGTIWVEKGRVQRYLRHRGLMSWLKN